MFLECYLLYITLETRVYRMSVYTPIVYRELKIHEYSVGGDTFCLLKCFGKTFGRHKRILKVWCI